MGRIGNYLIRNGTGRRDVACNVSTLHKQPFMKRAENLKTTPYQKSYFAILLQNNRVFQIKFRTPTGDSCKLLNSYHSTPLRVKSSRVPAAYVTNDCLDSCSGIFYAVPLPLICAVIVVIYFNFRHFRGSSLSFSS